MSEKKQEYSQEQLKQLFGGKVELEKLDHDRKIWENWKPKDTDTEFTKKYYEWKRSKELAKISRRAGELLGIKQEEEQIGP
jgi:isochorismate hydrolase